MNNDLTSLAVHRYPCKLQQPLTDDIILLHGWGNNSSSWSPLIPILQTIANVIALDLPGFGGSDEIPDFNLERVIELIVQHLPKKCTLMGWSLGGMLAVQIAQRHPLKISHVITLATNVKFVVGIDYETAMPISINRQFNKDFATDPSSTLKLFTSLLAQGDANERALLKQLRKLVDPQNINSNWLQALELLTQLDNREAFVTLMSPGLHILAENDALVPVSVEQNLAALNPKQQVSVIPKAAHAVHWSSPDLVAQSIYQFLLQDRQSVRDKKQMAHSFSRAAHTYDSVASLQRDVGDKLLQTVNVNTEINVILDLGCGTGYFTPKLQTLFPQALVAGLDIAEGMLHYSREQHEQQKYWICTDAEFLPFATSSVDLIYSNFALQWCENLSQLFAEIHRVLKPGGQCSFTTLGVDTLYELKSAWQQVDEFVHVNQFHHADVLVNVLEQQGLQIVEFVQKFEVMEFENLSDLTRSLKSLGAQNVNRGRASGLTGRKKINAFKHAYEIFRRNDLLPATYDVIYLTVKKQC